MQPPPDVRVKAPKNVDVSFSMVQRGMYTARTSAPDMEFSVSIGRSRFGLTAVIAKEQMLMYEHARRRAALFDGIRGRIRRHIKEEALREASRTAGVYPNQQK